MTWMDGRNYCKKYGKDLVSIHSYQQNEELRKKTGEFDFSDLRQALATALIFCLIVVLDVQEFAKTKGWFSFEVTEALWVELPEVTLTGSLSSSRPTLDPSDVSQVTS